MLPSQHFVMEHSTNYCHSASNVTHTRSVLTNIFPGEPGLAGCPLNFPSPFIPGLRILLGQTETFHVIPNTIPPGLFRASSCLIHSTSQVIKRLTQWWEASDICRQTKDIPCLFVSVLKYQLSNRKQMWGPILKTS